MLLIFGDGTAYCKFIHALPLSAKPTLLRPALWHWIWTTSSLPVGTMLSFASRGSQRDINWIRGYLLSVSGCFVAFLGCLAARSLQDTWWHSPSPQGSPAPHGGRFSNSISSTPTGSIPTSLADTPLEGFPVNFLSAPASFSASPTDTPTDDVLLVCPSLRQQWATATPSYRGWISALATGGEGFLPRP